MDSVPHAEPPQPTLSFVYRSSSPSPDTMPTHAIKDDAAAENLRCLSTASSTSLGSANTDAFSLLSLGSAGRDSLGSDVSSSGLSRKSSDSYPALSPGIPLSSSSNPKRLSGISTITSSSANGNSTEQRTTKRRGYMRPQGTDFAASARSRESVLSLGSIAHLQHYFARTGLLDIKGQLERRRRGGKYHTLDLSQLEGTGGYLTPRVQSATSQLSDNNSGCLGVQTDTDSSYASMVSSPDFVAHSVIPGMMVDSPIQERDDYGNDNWYPEDFEGFDPAVMLPPTVSTYMHREKPLPKPPTLAELRADLKRSLDNASKVLNQAREAKNVQGAPTTPINSAPSSPARQFKSDGTPVRVAALSWYEIQGMHILDVITLAIRAAKVYYTSHENPDRLDSIKSEREVRSELLAVMDVLKRMATRSFSGGIRTEEICAIEGWVKGLYAMLDDEDAMISAEEAAKTTWSWLRDEDWPAKASDDPVRAYARELAFLKTILSNGSAPGENLDVDLPDWVPMDRSTSTSAPAPPANDITDSSSITATGTTPAPPNAPTAFLQHMQNGVCLVRLHNCAVRTSRRRFGAIPTFHSDTQKPYRAADNLRYWVKAAELRWQVLLKIDALGTVCNSRPDVWPVFEDSIYKWCRKVREEISSELA